MSRPTPRYSLIPGFALSDAAPHDGRQLGKLLNPKNAASPYLDDKPSMRRCSHTAGSCGQSERPKLRGKPMAPGH